MTYPSILPPGSTPLELALEQVAAGLLDVAVPIRAVWSPAACPLPLLPWLAWGFSVDIWDADWPEATKRAAVAGAIAEHRTKGTRASLQTVIDRYDALIRVVEWFDDRDVLPPHTFRLELPLAAETAVTYTSASVAALLRDIAAVKPARSHVYAVHKLACETATYLLSGAAVAGLTRVDTAADLAAPRDPTWANYLQTEDGEPIRDGDGPDFLEHD